jgi:hypothetical protein
MADSELTVACVMVQNYEGCGAEYVNALHAAVERNMTVPHKFVCFTDSPNGINCECRASEGVGWFAKLHLFRQFTKGRVIFFDLDTLIVDNIDFLAKFHGKFAILSDFYRPKGFGSGIMLWEGGWGHHITNGFVALGSPNIVGGDQMYIEQQAGKAKMLQDLYPGKIASYKLEALTGIPRRAAIICFHGTPKPHEFSFGYVAEHWRKR